MMTSVNGASSYSHFVSYGIQGKSYAGKHSKAGLASFAFGDDADFLDNPAEALKAEKEKRDQQMRELVRNLQQTSGQNSNVHTGTLQDKKNGFLDLSGSSGSDKNKVRKKPLHYNSKEVEIKIRQARTSLGAGQALITAKRKVVQIKAKISANEGDAEEMQLALTHARRMEMVARKKKHHLELEEMAQITQKRNERQDSLEEAATEMKNAMVSAEEEKISKQEEEIFDARQEQIAEAAQQIAESMSEYREQTSEMTDEMLAELNEMISEFGEEELKELEEAMEMLETLEVIDPHMSKEDLEELKKKHRASEEKAMLKADMDYLKGMIKHQMHTSALTSGMSTVNTSVSGQCFAGVSIPEGSLSTISASEGISIDMHV